MTETEKRILRLLGYSVARDHVCGLSGYDHLPNLSDMATLDRRCGWAQPEDGSRDYFWESWQTATGFIEKLNDEFDCIIDGPVAPTRIEAMQKAFLSALEADNDI